MTRRMSRRTAAKLFVSAAAVLALPKSAASEPAFKGSSKPKLTAAERQKLAKSVGQLQGAAQKIRDIRIPMGTEPAFVFHPLSAQR